MPYCLSLTDHTKCITLLPWPDFSRLWLIHPKSKIRGRGGGTQTVFFHSVDYNKPPQQTARCWGLPLAHLPIGLSQFFPWPKYTVESQRFHQGDYEVKNATEVRTKKRNKKIHVYRLMQWKVNFSQFAKCLVFGCPINLNLITVIQLALEGKQYSLYLFQWHNC